MSFEQWLEAACTNVSGKAAFHRILGPQAHRRFCFFWPWIPCRCGVPLVAHVRSSRPVPTPPASSIKENGAGGGTSEGLPDENEVGTREDLLYALGACARLCYGTGLFDTEGSDWGHLDPPLEGEGWIVIDQICETMNSEETVQAGLYVPAGRNLPIAIVAFRGHLHLEGCEAGSLCGIPIAKEGETCDKRGVQLSRQVSC